MSEQKKGSSNKLTVILIVLGILMVATVITIVVIVSSLIKTGDNTPTQYVISTPQTEAVTETSWTYPAELTTEYTDINIGETVISDVVADAATQGDNEYSVPTPTEQSNVSTTSGEDLFNELKNKTKQGDPVLNDSPDNEFISLISSKYKVSPELLVAIYSVPDNGTNFVLQFKNERDADGNVVKSPDTLEKVYNIDKDRSIKIATGKMTGNVGVNYAESLLCFGLVTESVMCQYPDYFTGVEDKRPNH